jgi:hypothetical protein
MSSKKKLLAELCVKQRKHDNEKYQLEINDLTRFLKHVDTSIFNTDECVLWSGSLTKCNNGKSHYVNYYLNKRKLALHRILYINFIGDLDNKQYLKYICDNPGNCCNIKHFIKVNDEEIDDKNSVESEEIEVKEPKKIVDNVIIRKLATPGSPGNKIVIVFND